MPVIGFPVSKNCCYTYVGDQLVYDETFAKIKQRDVHQQRLEEFKNTVTDDLNLNYIKVANTQVNAVGNTNVNLTLFRINKGGFITA